MKNYQKKDTLLRLAIIAALLFVLAQATAAQTTAFNFQGRLNDGTTPANGRYDLEFRLYDAITGDNQIGTAIQKPNTILVNGVFSVQLDFGLQAFPGADRFIEVRLRATGSGNGFLILGVRQQLLAAPFAIRSSRATLADDATHAVQADNAGNSSSLGGVAAANYLQKNGDGSQLTNVTAVNSQQFGGKLPSNYVRISDGVFVVLNGSTSSPVAFGGNLIQADNVSGLPKAIAYLDRDGNIISCYNGITGVSTGGCGFTTYHGSIGIYNINFGFNVTQRAKVGTSGYDGGTTVLTISKQIIPSSSDNGIQVTISYIHSDSEIWRDHVGEFTNAPFSVVVY